MDSEEEISYWKNRALIAEGAADKLGNAVEALLPYLKEGQQLYEIYQRWARWKMQRDMMQQSESNNQEETK